MEAPRSLLGKCFLQHPDPHGAAPGVPPPGLAHGGTLDAEEGERVRHFCPC